MESFLIYFTSATALCNKILSNPIKRQISDYFIVYIFEGFLSMINQIQNSADKNVFAPLQRSSGATYAITKPFTETQKTEIKKEEEKKDNRLGVKIAEYALIAGFGLLLATRLFSKKSRMNVNGLSKFLGKKMAKLNEHKQLSGAQNFYYNVLKGAKKIVNRSQTIFNIATLKDIVFQMGLKKTPITRKFSDNVSNLFQKISVMTCSRAYRKTQNKFDNLYAEFAQANNNLPRGKHRLATEKLSNIKNNVYCVCSKEGRNQRLAQINNDLKGIDSLVYDQTWKHLGRFIKNAKDGKFIAQDLASNAKLKLHNSVYPTKDKITFSIYDHYQTLRHLLKSIDPYVDVTDKQSRILMESLKHNLTNYKKVLEGGESKTKLPKKKEIAKSLEDLKNHINESKVYDKDTKDAASKAVEKFRKTLINDNKEGEVQELMDIYKQHLSKEDYAKLKKKVDKTLKSLNHSVDLETDKLFDKIRDLKLGAAPHDVLAFVASLGVMGYGVSKADSKDQRMSVTLKYGIPAVGAVAITTICTVGLIASGPSLLIGLVSGLVMNKLGEVADNTRKKYQEKPLNLMDITIPTSILPSDKQREKFKNFINPQ